ncbi:MAG: ATP synthase subunit I [Proteobacteria bacterium]|nr:ATP synthase subunit I [Pseudomonadota bacterium]
MTEEELIKSRTTADRMLTIEAIAVGVCGLLFFVFVSLEFAYSVILGGLAFILPNAVFVRFSLRTSETGSSANTLTWFYIGEAIKIVTTIIIFSICIVLITPLNIGLMFISYIVVLLMNLTGLAIFFNE